MDLRRIVHELKTADLSEIEIARRLTEAGTPVSQSTINRIANGETDRTSYLVGKALEKLHRKCRGRIKVPTPNTAAA